MVNVTELKIGSKLKWGIHVVTVSGIHRDTDLKNKKPHIYVDFKDGRNMCFGLEEVDHIPLTEEILIKCGFKKWGRDNMPRTISYELGEMRIFPSNSFCDFIGFGFIHYKLANFEDFKNESAHFKLTSLHQLQDLYYLRIGKELEVNI